MKDACWSFTPDFKHLEQPFKAVISLLIFFFSTGATKRPHKRAADDVRQQEDAHLQPLINSGVLMLRGGREEKQMSRKSALLKRY